MATPVVSAQQLDELGAAVDYSFTGARICLEVDVQCFWD
jgi:hypothetical protein